MRKIKEENNLRVLSACTCTYIHAHVCNTCTYSQLRLIGILLIGISGSDRDFSPDKPLL